MGTFDTHKPGNLPEDKDVTALAGLLLDAEQDPEVIKALKKAPFGTYGTFKKLLKKVRDYKPQFAKYSAAPTAEPAVSEMEIDPEYLQLRKYIDKVRKNKHTPAAVNKILIRTQEELKKVPRPVDPKAKKPGTKPEDEAVDIEDLKEKSDVPGFQEVKLPKPGEKPTPGKVEKPGTEKTKFKAPKIEKESDPYGMPEWAEPLGKHLKKNPKYKTIYRHLPDEITKLLNELAQGIGFSQPEGLRMRVASRYLKRLD